MALKVTSSREFRDWVSNLELEKQKIISRLVTRIREKPDKKSHYVFPRIIPRTCHAVLEESENDQKIYILYEKYNDGVRILGCGIYFKERNTVIFDFEIYNRDDLITFGGFPPL
jgi:hypothetical protein